MKAPEYNIFIIGAGFSHPAGIPLATDLWKCILQKSKEKLKRNNVEYSLYENILKPDIDSFIAYYNGSKNGQHIKYENDIELESFISYLDIEAYLGLLGSKHWSAAGNQSQILIRNYIAKIIYEKQSRMTSSDKLLYDKFVSLLRPKDLILTFNYDTILEEALERNNIPFAFYWEKLKKNKDGEIILDIKNEDVILLKMHGSIDWISDKHFVSASSLAIWNREKKIFNPKCIIKGYTRKNNELRCIYRISRLSEYLSMNEPVVESPFIMSPSFNKIVYLNPLKEFWHGFIGNGQWSERLIFIGFSLPEHDEYIRQPLYYLVKNFESSAKEDNRRISIVDYKISSRDQNKFKANYRFLNEEITDFYFEGFSEAILNLIFKDVKK